MRSVVVRCVEPHACDVVCAGVVVVVYAVQHKDNDHELHHDMALHVWAAQLCFHTGERGGTPVLI